VAPLSCAAITVTRAHSLLPLAILEAMRSLDSPSDEEVAEYVDELLKKRLGLSDTVAAQIARYERSARRGGSVSAAEFEQVLRLAGRRSDAALVFADGGRRAARRAIARLWPTTRWAARYLPRPLGRAAGFGAARRLARDVFALMLRKDGAVPSATLEHELAVRATSDGTACGFYAAALSELLRHLVGFEGAVSHDDCRCRGDARCTWRPR
jgi:hypothetical protein